MNDLILVTEPNEYAPEALAIYETLGDVSLGMDNMDACPDGEVSALVIRFSYVIDENFLSRFPHLKYLISPTTGLNHIDLDYCANNSIEVISLKGEREFLVNVTATAELAFGFILGLVRNIYPCSNAVLKNKIWDRDKFKGRELSGLRLGIIGFGRLGRRMARLASAFKMETIVCDPYVKQQIFEEHGVRECSKDELFRKSDIVTVHVDLRADNVGMIGRGEFSAMKTGSWFINTSRGEVVDEDALLEALENKTVAGAALDVLAEEEKPDELFKKSLIEYGRNNNNLIVTSHIGGCAIESMMKTEIFCAKKLRAAIEARGDA